MHCLGGKIGGLWCSGLNSLFFSFFLTLEMGLWFLGLAFGVVLRCLGVVIRLEATIETIEQYDFLFLNAF